MKTLSLVLVALLCAGVLQADVPQTMSYQGVLRDGVGNPVPDDYYNLTFGIYDVPSGGSALWTETQGLPVEDGILNAVLGSVVPVALPFDMTYWLGISVEGEPELSPRTELTSAPYAQRAAYADVGTDTDWTIAGDDIYRLPGNVGIGVPAPSEKLDVEGTAKMTGFQLATSPAAGHVLTSDGTGVGTWQPADPLTLPYSGEVSSSSDAFAVTNSDSGTAIRGHASGTGEGGFFSVGNVGSNAAALHAYTDGTGPALYSHTAGDGKAGHFDGDVYVTGGSVGIGVPTPTATLDVDGTAKVTGFQLTTAPSPGHVLMSDASGVGTWQPASGTIGGGGVVDYMPKFTGATTIGNSIIYETMGRVSIGTTTSDAKLRVENAGNISALKIENTSSGHGFSLVKLSRTQPPDSDDTFLEIVSPVGTGPGFDYIHCVQVEASGWFTPFAVSGTGNIESSGTIKSVSDGLIGINGVTYYESDDAAAVEGRFMGGAYDGVGVSGVSERLDYYGIGGCFEGGHIGAHGFVEPTGSHSYVGVYGECDGGSGTNTAVLGSASGTGTNYGVWGNATGGATNWAGYFVGDVRVTGTFTNPGPVLEMDHPSDPENRYLHHALVASSEMKTVYDGTVVLDASGESVVELPDWCEALNTDFRYQLTAIGAPGPNLYVADKVAGNRFRIAGGDPGMEVSWMLTGVRHDAHAQANGMSVEEWKGEDNRGKYLHPEAHGASPTLAIGRHVEDEEKRRRPKVEQIPLDTGRHGRAGNGGKP